MDAISALNWIIWLKSVQRGNENIELALMAIEEHNTKEEVIGMMVMSDSDAEDDSSQISTSNLKRIYMIYLRNN